MEPGEGSRAYFFVNEEHRQPLVIERELRRIVEKNHKVVKPMSDQEYIISGNTGIVGKPLAPRAFNTMLDNIFREYGIAVDLPSSITLRRTFARKTWQDYKKSKDIIKELAMELQLYIGSVEKYVQI